MTFGTCHGIVLQKVGEVQRNDRLKCGQADVSPVQNEGCGGSVGFVVCVGCVVLGLGTAV